MTRGLALRVGTDADRLPVLARLDGHCTDLAAGDRAIGLVVGKTNEGLPILAWSKQLCKAGTSDLEIGKRYIGVVAGKTAEGLTILASWCKTCSSFQLCESITLPSTAMIVVGPTSALDVNAPCGVLGLSYPGPPDDLPPWPCNTTSCTTAFSPPPMTYPEGGRWLGLSVQTGTDLFSDITFARAQYDTGGVIPLADFQGAPFWLKDGTYRQYGGILSNYSCTEDPYPHATWIVKAAGYRTPWIAFTGVWADTNDEPQPDPSVWWHPPDDGWPDVPNWWLNPPSWWNEEENGEYDPSLYAPGDAPLPDLPAAESLEAVHIWVAWRHEVDRVIDDHGTVVAGTHVEAGTHFFTFVRKVGTTATRCWYHALWNCVYSEYGPSSQLMSAFYCLDGTPVDESIKYAPQVGTLYTGGGSPTYLACPSNGGAPTGIMTTYAQKAYVNGAGRPAYVYSSWPSSARPVAPCIVWGVGNYLNPYPGCIDVPPGITLQNGGFI